MIRDLSVQPVQFRNEPVGFRVAALTRQCSDSLYDEIAHCVIFQTRERAERFLARVKAVPPHQWDRQHWTVEYAATLYDAYCPLPRKA